MAIDYATFEKRVRFTAVSLAADTQPGDRVMLLFEPGLEYLVAFFACLYAGVVAVPAYPPEPHRRAGGQSRLHAIWRDASPRLILTSGDTAARVADAFEAVGPALRVLEPYCGQDVEPPARHIEPGSTAFLQYTSGSTADPRGVMVTHGNILANELMIANAFGHDASTVVVSWLPLYHDMGLIGNMLQPVFVGGECVVMSPTTFLRNPALWLEAITRYGATTSGAPNFAYEACVQRMSDEALSRLDLRTWKVAYCGSEPIREATLRRFAERFAACGFDAAALYPCYGLAEATLLVTGSVPGQGVEKERFAKAALEAGKVSPDPQGAYLVSSGKAEPPCDVTIVDVESGHAVEGERVGEIWVSGPNVAAGYFGKAALSQDTFCAKLPGSDKSYLRTGDLGFLRDGQLYVVDRIKSLIIIGGRNLYASQLESCVEGAHPGFVAGGSAAFSVHTDTDECLGIAVELLPKAVRRLDTAAVSGALRRVLTEEQGVAPSVIALCRRGALPRTSSGKLQRTLCERLLRAGDLETVWLWSAPRLGKLFPRRVVDVRAPRHSFEEL